MTINFLRLVIFWLTFVFLCKCTFSQVNSDHQIVEANRSINCEYTSAIFDSFTQGNAVNKKIIIISYLGKKDRKEEIAKKRLRAAKKYLTEYYKGTPFGRKPEKIITATANDKTKDESLVKPYNDGIQKNCGQPGKDLGL